MRSLLYNGFVKNNIRLLHYIIIILVYNESKARNVELTEAWSSGDTSD